MTSTRSSQRRTGQPAASPGPGTRLTVPLLDPIESIPPDPITVVPVVLVAIVAPALLLAALVGGWLTERRARSADLGQVMRLAD